VAGLIARLRDGFGAQVVSPLWVCDHLHRLRPGSSPLWALSRGPVRLARPVLPAFGRYLAAAALAALFLPTFAWDVRPRRRAQSRPLRTACLASFRAGGELRGSLSDLLLRTPATGGLLTRPLTSSSISAVPVDRCGLVAARTQEHAQQTAHDVFAEYCDPRWPASPCSRGSQEPVCHQLVIEQSGVGAVLPVNGQSSAEPARIFSYTFRTKGRNSLWGVAPPPGHGLQIAAEGLEARPARPAKPSARQNRALVYGILHLYVHPLRIHLKTGYKKVLLLGKCAYRCWAFTPGRYRCR